MSHTTQAERKEEMGIAIPTPLPMPSAAKAPTENKEGKRGFHEWLNILAYPVAAISGALVWRTQVYEESHASHDGKGAFDDLKEKSRDEYKSIINRTDISPEEINKKIHTNNVNFREGRRQILERMNVNNLWDHFKDLSSHSKNNALISGFTVTGIALGVMLTVANSKSFLGGKSEEAKDSGISK